MCRALKRHFPVQFITLSNQVKEVQWCQRIMEWANLNYNKGICADDCLSTHMVNICLAGIN